MDALAAAELPPRVARLEPIGNQRWRIEDGALCVVLAFPDFVTAFAFMTAVAFHAEKQDHHPEWSNVYGRVSIRLTTHDAGGITERDFRLAAAIHACARPYYDTPA